MYLVNNYINFRNKIKSHDANIKLKVKHVEDIYSWFA